MNGERLCLPLQVTLKLERTAFHSANMCCGQYWDDGEPEFLDVGLLGLVCRKKEVFCFAS